MKVSKYKNDSKLNTNNELQNTWPFQHNIMTRRLQTLQQVNLVFNSHFDKQPIKIDENRVWCNILSSNWWQGELECFELVAICFKFVVGVGINRDKCLTVYHNDHTKVTNEPVWYLERSFVAGRWRNTLRKPSGNQVVP